MAAVILALAALAISCLAGFFAWCAVVNSSEALDAATFANFQPDAILTTEDGEEIEFRMDRGH